MRDSADILIVGAGPVGLFLATSLARAGVDAVVIERMETRTFFTKALGVSSRTLEIFDDLGIAHDAIDAGLFLRGVTGYDGDTVTMNLDIPADLPFGSLSLAQMETERVLEEALHRHGGRVAYGTALTGFREEGDGVVAELAGPDGAARTFACRYIVGCDGAHSRVRATLGLDFAGGQYPQTFVLGDLEVAWDLPRGRFYRFSKDGASLAAVPVAGSPARYRLSMALPQEGEAPAAPGEAPTAPSLDALATLMTPILPAGTRLSTLHWSSVYRVSHRIVPAYGRGRAFIAGDAAHIHPPVGGQGMNTGLQDAHNLAWKLALAVRGLAAPGLLESYSTERHAIGLAVVGATSRALDAVIAGRPETPGMRETQLLVGYRGSPIVADDRADAASAELVAGDRAPDAGGLRRAYVALPFRLHERLGRGRFVLLGALGADGAGTAALAATLRGLRERLDGTAAGLGIAPAGAAFEAPEGLPVATDADGAFAAAYGGAPGAAWLVRPDGYLGWVSDVASPEGLAAALAPVVAVSRAG